MIITARIRRMGERNAFSLFTPEWEYPHPIPTGGTPILPDGGYAHPIPMEGVPPSSPIGVWVPPSSPMGVPHPVLMGYPRQVSMGYPLPCWDGGTPLASSWWWYLFHWDWMEVLPPQETEQQSEYLLCGGRYASCVHARGLSSVKIKLDGAKM